jgi:ribosomal protein S18 acetylase RimI-like enzyme
VNAPEISLRPARLQDVLPAVRLIRLSMGEEIDWLFGQEPGHPADSVVSELYHRRGNRVSHSFCWVAEQAGQVIGLLLAYPGHRMRRLELRTGWQLVSIFGLAATLRLARRQPAYGDLVEAQAGEYYVSNVAVDPVHQGRGIGGVLLAQAEGQARAEGLGKCSLIVTYDNPARRLYERCGYQVVSSFDVDHPVLAHGSGGFHRMVKTLADAGGGDG